MQLVNQQARTGNPPDPDVRNPDRIHVTPDVTRPFPPHLCPIVIRDIVREHRIDQHRIRLGVRKPEHRHRTHDRIDIPVERRSTAVKQDRADFELTGPPQRNLDPAAVLERYAELNVRRADAPEPQHHRRSHQPAHAESSTLHALRLMLHTSGVERPGVDLYQAVAPCTVSLMVLPLAICTLILNFCILTSVFICVAPYEGTFRSFCSATVFIGDHLWFYLS